MTAVPATWNLNGYSVGVGSAGFVIPAPAAGIRRIITSITFTVISTDPALRNFNLTVSTPGPISLLVRDIKTPGVVAPDSVTVEFADSDLVIIGAPGQSMTFFTSANPSANYVQSLLVKGYNL